MCVYIKILQFIIILIELKTPSTSRYSLPLSTWFLQVAIASFSGLPKGFLPIQYTVPTLFAILKALLSICVFIKVLASVLFIIWFHH